MNTSGIGGRGLFALLLVGTMGLSGCAAGRALDKPAEKDYDVLEVGTDRDLVRAELGQPMVSAVSSSCDLFAFEEGSGGFKYLRAAGYSLLAVGTLGISEMVTNPVEAAVGNDKVRVRVCYDQRQNVSYSEVLRVGKPAKLMSGSYPPPEPVKAAEVVAPPPVAAPVPPPVPAAVEAVASEPAASEPATGEPVAEAEATATAALQAVEASLVEDVGNVETPQPTASEAPTPAAPATATPAN